MDNEFIDVSANIENENTNTKIDNYSVSLINRYAEDLTKKTYYADPAIARDGDLPSVIFDLFLLAIKQLKLFRIIEIS